MEMAGDSNALADPEAMFGQDDEETKAAERTVLTQNRALCQLFPRLGHSPAGGLLKKYREHKTGPAAETGPVFYTY